VQMPVPNSSVAHYGLVRAIASIETHEVLPVLGVSSGKKTRGEVTDKASTPHKIPKPNILFDNARKLNN